MNVVFVSNCEKKAITKTRAILDRIATRVGQGTWVTPITEEVLLSVRQSLKKIATRQTSVACYRNDGGLGLRLLWLVGNRRSYTSDGTFAAQSLSRKEGESLFAQHVSLVAAGAGLLHDIGKATTHSQNKYETNAMVPDGVRHEWISAWLIEHIPAEWDHSALELAWGMWKTNGLSSTLNKGWVPGTLCDAHSPNDLSGVRTATGALLFCVATHHRMFGHGNTGRSTIAPEPKADKHIRKDISSPEGLTTCAITEWEAWATIMRTAKRALGRVAAIEAGNPSYWRRVAVTARAAVILADHHVSRQRQASRPGTAPVWAKSRLDENPKSNAGRQTLLWHLIHTAGMSVKNARLFEYHGLPALDEDTITKILSPAPTSSRFSWQNDCVDFFSNIRGERALVFNISGTGSGKTLGNLKILAALRGNGLRVTSAFNLRTLTTQTTDAYQNKIGIPKEDVACVIGDEAMFKLNATTSQEIDIPLSLDIFADAEFQHALPDWVENLPNKKDQALYRRLLGSPVLVTTADHIVSAGILSHQGRHALALIRLASSDLILDEVDSFSPNDIPVMLLLVEAAAMLGRNVVISSATVPTVLAAAIVDAWESGKRMVSAERLRESRPHIVCVNNMVKPAQFTGDNFSKFYEGFATNIVEAENSTEHKTKIARIVDLTHGSITERIKKSAKSLHSANCTEICSDKKVSIGLVRMAHIAAVTKLAANIARETADDHEYDIFLCAYHSRDISLRRGMKERVLDEVLMRTEDPKWWIKNDEISALVEKSTAKNIIFMLLASPVEEVGRDHDFDWAIIEPSSMGSIIQTAGRVNRHRLRSIVKPNIHILNRSYLHWDGKSNGSYTRPGYRQEIEEVKGKKKSTHTRDDGSTMTCAELFEIAIEPRGAGTQSIASEAFTLTSEHAFGHGKNLFMREDERGMSHILESAMAHFSSPNSWCTSWLFDTYGWRKGRPMDQYVVECSLDGPPKISIRYEGGGKFAAAKFKKGFAAATNVSADICFMGNSQPPKIWNSPLYEDLVLELRKAKRHLTEGELTSLQSFSYERNDKDATDPELQLSIWGVERK